ncbi:MAG: DUF4954 family protein [Chitinispirillales bacterium]|jgi:hypothetical protein|nr:DUF4954 family protein [Chitinispirillales bacterium]
MEEIIKQWGAERPADRYRALTSKETARLEGQGNTAANWGDVRVAVKGFDADRVRGCRFEGRISIGAFNKDRLQYGNISLKTGLYNSHFNNICIDDDVAIHNLLFSINQHISDSVLIFGVNEISSAVGATFGMSVDADHQYPINVINENGGRAILPYPGMTCTDAYLWAKFRDDGELLAKLTEMTYAACRYLCPKAAIIADNAVIINTRAVRDTLIGPSTVVDGAELISNSTVLSDGDEPTFIGPAVQIRSSIIGYGNKIDSAAQLSSVMTGTAAAFSKAARADHSVVGDCANIACCEIANSLIMPMNAQHHNNSFLIASSIGGQSNIAAGATVGSNHNSRVNDGEIWAKRGFWPGLCVSLRHNSRFASFTMIAKGAYQTEIDLKLPFSLIAMDEKSNSATVFPAFWFTHNMYVVMRSAQKFAARDKRVHRDQFIEHDPLAPDTVDEILDALNLIEQYNAGADNDNTLRSPPLRHADAACKAYRMMARYYCAKNILPYMKENGLKNLKELINSLGGLHIFRWVDILSKKAIDMLLDGSRRASDNVRLDQGRWIDCGGAIITVGDLENIINTIKSGDVSTWAGARKLLDGVRKLFVDRAAAYKKNEKIGHAVYSLAVLEGTDPEDIDTSIYDKPTESFFNAFLESVPEDCAEIAARTAQSRAKDYENPFRVSTYESTEEMINVLGPAEDAVVIKTAGEMDELAALAKELRA